MAPKRRGDIRVRVKPQSGRLLTFWMSPTDTIGDLAAKMYERNDLVDADEMLFVNIGFVREFDVELGSLSLEHPVYVHWNENIEESGC